MLQIECPFCGKRNLTEFSYGGQAHIPRPQNIGSISDAEFARYLFVRKNPIGVHQERWNHAMGCRRWFNAVRHTVTDQFWATYKVGETSPIPPSNWDGVCSRTECENLAEAK